MTTTRRSFIGRLVACVAVFVVPLKTSVTTAVRSPFLTPIPPKPWSPETAWAYLMALQREASALGHPTRIHPRQQAGPGAGR